MPGRWHLRLVVHCTALGSVCDQPECRAPAYISSHAPSAHTHTCIAHACVSACAVCCSCSPSCGATSWPTPSWPSGAGTSALQCAMRSCWTPASTTCLQTTPTALSHSASCWHSLSGTSHHGKVGALRSTACTGHVRLRLRSIAPLPQHAVLGTAGESASANLSAWRAQAATLPRVSM